MLIGHERVKKFFDSAIENGRIGHAYCLVGPAQVGKRTLAEIIIAKLLNRDRAKLFTHPDVRLVEQIADEKTGKLKKDIAIEQIIDLRAALARSSLAGGYRAAIIDGADKLNAKSANALLKTLEEPKGRAIVFLITTDEADLPATIVSRCQTLYMAPVPSQTIANALLARGAEPVKAYELARRALGRTGRALSWLVDPTAYENYLNELHRWQALWGRPLHEKLKAVEPLFGDKSDHIAERERLRGTIELWELDLRDRLLNNSVAADIGLKIHRALAQAKEFLDKNVHPKLLVDQILLVIP